MSAPSFIHFSSMYGNMLSLFPTLVVALMISLSLTASSIVSHTTIFLICGKSVLTYSTNESIDFCPRPLIFTVSIPGHTLKNAAKLVFPITPGPMIEATFESFLARYLAPTPGIAPVL